MVKSLSRSASFAFSRANSEISWFIYLQDVLRFYFFPLTFFFVEFKAKIRTPNLFQLVHFFEPMFILFFFSFSKIVLNRLNYFLSVLYFLKKQPLRLALQTQWTNSLTITCLLCVFRYLKLFFSLVSLSQRTRGFSSLAGGVTWKAPLLCHARIIFLIRLD